MNLQQNSFSNAFDYLYPLHYQHPPILNEKDCKTDLDYLDANTMDKHSLLDRHPNTESYDTWGFKDMQRVLQNLNHQQTVPSLVDVVREKNYQTKVNSFGKSTLEDDCVDHCNDSNNLMRFEVDDPSSWGTNTLFRSAAEGTTISNRNMNRYSPSPINDLLTQNAEYLNCDAGFIQRNIQNIPNSSRMPNYANDGFVPSQFVVDSNNFSGNTWNPDANFYPYNNFKSSSFETASAPLTRKCKKEYSSLFGDSITSTTNNSDSECVGHLGKFDSLPSSNSKNVYDTSTFLSKLNQQLEMISCISCMSQEQLRNLMNVMQEVLQYRQNPPMMNRADGSEIHSLLQSNLIELSKLQSNLSELNDYGLESEVSNSRSLDRAMKKGKDQCLDNGEFQDVPGALLQSSFSSNQQCEVTRLIPANNGASLLESEARNHYAAVRENVDAPYIWSGELPKRLYEAPFSNKVFIGGLPYQITEEMLINAFSRFGNLVVEWPEKEGLERPRGYAYITFEKEFQVKCLLKSCREYEGNLFYKISLRKFKLKEVQVIPWSILDSFYVPTGVPRKLNAGRTVYVGAIHGTMNAEGLFRVMNDLFDGVIYAGICVDKHKYPTGSARVTFNNHKSYEKAVAAGFVNIKTPKFTRKVQMDPFLEDVPCSVCYSQLGPYFCRVSACFRYFCADCWVTYHEALRLPHKPLVKNSKLGPSAHALIGLSNSLYSY